MAGKYIKGTRKALKEIEQIPHVPMRIVILDYTATHCGIREIATRAFDLPCEGIESHKPVRYAIGDTVFFDHCVG